MSERILFVDDDANLLSALQRTLRKQFALEIATGPREAFEMIRQRGPFAVVVADMRMPGMDGLTFLEHLLRIAPDTVRVMLTGNPDQMTTAGAINRGHVSRFLAKPCPPEVLIPVLTEGVKHYLRVTSERAVLESTVTESIRTLIEIFGLAVPEAHHRGEFLRSLVRGVGTVADLGSLWELETAALLSMIGLVSLPPDLVRKREARVALSPVEEAMIRRVPQVGHDLLHRIPRLENVARIIRYQEKHVDGTGVPDDGCKGDDIPVGARLLKILNDRLELELSGRVGPTAQAIMSERFGVYDYRLLATCFQRYPSMLRPPVDEEKPPRALAISELLPGHRLHSDIAATSGIVLAAAGQQITVAMIERLANQVELGEVREPFLIVDGSGPDSTAGNP